MSDGITDGYRDARLFHELDTAYDTLWSNLTYPQKTRLREALAQQALIANWTAEEILTEPAMYLWLLPEIRGYQRPVVERKAAMLSLARKWAGV